MQESTTTWWTQHVHGQPLCPEEVERTALALRAELTAAEKLHLLAGDTPLISGGLKMLRAYNTTPLPAGAVPRLGIPGVQFTDGPRGVVMYRSTCFPVPMARGASFDPDLEERIGDAIGVEARAQGANLFAGVCINVLRHPAWGRAQETYGEDPHHLGEMGSALLRGVQRHVMGCVKHFALNSIENARFKVDVQVDEKTLRDIYLPHFERCVREGAAAVMSAYNRVNGQWCGHSRELLQTILKEEWGFDGFVMSDFLLGVRGPTAVANGQDLEMPFTLHFGQRLQRALSRGTVTLAQVDAAVLRLLRQQIHFANVGTPERDTRKHVASPAHRALARQAAAQSIVLLENRVLPNATHPLLPLDWNQHETVALIGALADRANLGDEGSSMVRPPSAVSPRQGLAAALPATTTLQYHDGTEIAQAVRTAAAASVAIVVVGYTHNDEGENILFKGGDRISLRLRPHDEELIRAVAAVQPRTIVIMEGGSAIITETWRHRVAAILMAWYPGMEGGHAIADVLSGVVNPSAKLPCIFPKREADLPHFDPNARHIRYDAFHGYRLLDHTGHEPAYAFGYGLSYTTFALENIELAHKTVPTDGSIDITLSLHNNGPRDGAEVVQVYIGPAQPLAGQNHRQLRAFRRVALATGQRKTVHLCIPVAQIGEWEVATHQRCVQPGMYRVAVGTSTRTQDLSTHSLCVTAK